MCFDGPVDLIKLEEQFRNFCDRSSPLALPDPVPFDLIDPLGASFIPPTTSNTSKRNTSGAYQFLFVESVAAMVGRHSNYYASRVLCGENCFAGGF